MPISELSFSNMNIVAGKGFQAGNSHRYPF